MLGIIPAVQSLRRIPPPLPISFLPILLVMIEIHPMNRQPRATPFRVVFAGIILKRKMGVFFEPHWLRSLIFHFVRR
jgi:hypothetical protein